MAAAIMALLEPVIGPQKARFACDTLDIDPLVRDAPDTGLVPRAVIAFALNAALFTDLLERVPSAARYVAQVREAGGTILSDHGALRTIDGETGALPSGRAAIARLLEPLGYREAGIYPLPALRMTGRAYAHADFPETIPQFFVSELHVDQLGAPAQAAAAAIFGSSCDPLDDAARDALERLEASGSCSREDAIAILHAGLTAFDRQHPEPAVAHYETLLAESREGGWIATEGNAFNHATTRVAHVEALAQDLRERGFAMKPAVEVSASGRVRQTAFLADRVERAFRGAEDTAERREVPGSFYEFITRDIDPETGRLDLRFDSGNATGIFAMTRESGKEPQQEQEVRA